MLSIRNLTAGYSTNNVVITNFNLEINKGEKLVITGQNGSGKSTLGRAIMGFLPYIKGEIRWQGQDITYLPSHVRNELGIGYFFQGGRAFRHLTIRENLKVASIKQRSLNFKKTLIELESYFELLGKERKIDFPAGDLSGGERHQLALVMVMVSCPCIKLLIADEPSAGLSEKNSVNMQKFFVDISNKIPDISILIFEQNTNIFSAKYNFKTIQIHKE